MCWSVQISKYQKCLILIFLDSLCLYLFKFIGLIHSVSRFIIYCIFLTVLLSHFATLSPGLLSHIFLKKDSNYYIFALLWIVLMHLIWAAIKKYFLFLFRCFLYNYVHDHSSVFVSMRLLNLLWWVFLFCCMLDWIQICSWNSYCTVMSKLLLYIAYTYADVSSSFTLLYSCEVCPEIIKRFNI